MNFSLDNSSRSPRLRSITLALLVAAAGPFLLAAQESRGESQWSQWRGPGQLGVAPAGKYPTQWSTAQNQQVRWTAEIGGRGGSTPIVWGDHAFLTSGDEGKNTIWAIDLTSGKVSWKLPVGGDTGGKHQKGSGSNPSLVTDGKNLFAYFRSGDLACVSLDGKLVWQTSVPQQLSISFDDKTLWWDLGTSPVLTKDAVVLAIMHSGPSYLAAFDKGTGKLSWKQDRTLDAPEEAAQSYSTPIVTEHGGKSLILVLGADHLTCHSATDGKELWRVGGFNPSGERFFRSIASPVMCGDIIVCPYARGKTLTGIDLKTHQVVWTRDDLGADVPTPASKDGKVYVATDKGHFECIDGATGKAVWSGDLPKSRKAFSSSPLVTSDHIYVTREDGVTFVLNANEPFTVVSESAVEEPPTPLVASPVPVQNGLLIRGGNKLYCIGN